MGRGVDLAFLDYAEFAGAGCAVAITALICACARVVGERLGVISHPDNHRKLHKSATAQVGGIAILLGLMGWLGVALLRQGLADQALLRAVAISGFGVGLVGFADDQKGMTPLARALFIPVFLGAAFVLDPGFDSLRLNWGSFEPASISIWVYVPLMIITSVGLVNAVNMADGQDGIVGGLYVIWFACLTLVTSGTSAAIAAVLLLLSLVFLAFNLRSKVFLGDCGSYGVTFVLGLLVTLAHARGEVSLETVIVWFFIPVVDCLRIIISRMSHGLSPFSGDRDHFHHRLEAKMGKLKGLASYLAAVAATSLVATWYPRFALVCICVLCAFYFSFSSLAAVSVVAQKKAGAAPARESNVVPISSERKGAA